MYNMTHRSKGCLAIAANNALREGLGVSGKGRQNKRARVLSLVPVLFTLLLLPSCEEEIVPVNKQDSAFNFYCASNLLNSFAAEVPTIDIFIDSILTNPKNNVVQATYFGFTFNKSYINIERPYISGNNSLLYMRLDAGYHTFIFTDTAKLPLVQAEVETVPYTHYCLYLIDTPGADSTVADYRVLTVKEDFIREEGKVKIRMINLIGDVNSLRIAAVDGSGNEVEGVFPSYLAYGDMSAYAAIDTTGLVHNKQIILKIYDDMNNLLTVTGISAEVGASWVLLLEGFVKDAIRLVPEGKDAAGNTEYQAVNIPAGVTAVLRRSY
jgi:hypothetical protein